MTYLRSAVAACACDALLLTIGFPADDRRRDPRELPPPVTRPARKAVRPTEPAPPPRGDGRLGVPLNVPQDSFRNEAAGTAITSHAPSRIASPRTPLSGLTWSMNAANPGAQVIAAPGFVRGTQAATGSISVLSADASCTDYSVRCQFLYKGSTGGTMLAGLALRYSPSADTGYLVYIDAAGGNLVVDRHKAGVGTGLVSVRLPTAFPGPLVAGRHYDLEARVSGPRGEANVVAIGFRWQGQSIGGGVVYDTDAANSVRAPGRAGILLYGASTATTGLWLGNFEASYPSAAATGNDLNFGSVGDSITYGYPNTSGGSPGSMIARRLADGAGGLLRNVGVIDYGLSGATSHDWVSKSSNYTAYATQATAAGVSLTSYMIGVNDAKTAVATRAATYKANVRSFLTAELAAGRKVVLHYPTWVQPSGAFDSRSAALLASYCTATDELVAAHPGNVFAGSKLNYAFFRDRPGLLPDGAHPSDEAYRQLADLMAPAVADALRSPAVSKGVSSGGGFRALAWVPRDRPMPGRVGR